MRLQLRACMKSSVLCVSRDLLHYNGTTLDVKLRECYKIPDIKVQRGVYVLIGVNKLGTQSQVYIIYGLKTTSRGCHTECHCTTICDRGQRHWSEVNSKVSAQSMVNEQFQFKSTVKRLIIHKPTIIHFCIKLSIQKCTIIF